VLVEKPVGYLESMLALFLARALGDFVESRQLGIVLGADGPLRILAGQVRVPDVSFVGWQRFPRRELPRESILGVAPDLAVEVLSEGNTPAEMARKLDDYFRAGVRLVWYVDLRKRQIEVYRAVDQRLVLNESQDLEGYDVLPGFQLAIADLFAAIPKY
jgi:Uma2 family endonuclease